MTTIADMTVEDLKQFIEATLDERLTQLLGKFEITDDDQDEPNENLSWDEIRTAVEHHRWTPQPGGKSSLELLREDRER
jgi:N-acetyl-anhydromuramyl-L-alanine amidase AmpD